MTDYQKYINALRKCAKEHENDRTSIGHIIVSDLCRDTANLLEALEQETCDYAVSLTKEAYTDLVDRATKYSDLESCDDCVSRKEVFEIMGNLMSIPYDFDRPINKDDVSESMDAIKELPTVTPTQRWIPVSERLPDKTGMYLVSIGDLVTVESFDGYSFRTKSAFRVTPDAWMPLPKPYKAESEV